MILKVHKSLNRNNKKQLQQWTKKDEKKIQSQIQNESKYKSYKCFSWVSDVGIFSLINIDLSYILLFNLVFLFYFFFNIFVSFVFFALFLSTLLWSCFFVFVFLVNSVLNWLTLCLVSFACWVSLLYFGFFDLFWFHLCVGVCMYIFLCYCLYLSIFLNFSRIFCFFLICLF